MLSEDWMLITAGNDQQFNPMTASWEVSKPVQQTGDILFYQSRSLHL
ncbi:MAG: hypothetical protein ACLU4J_26620 [Butyricimonas paravirosa]